jgi:hypothetical protein
VRHAKVLIDSSEKLVFSFLSFRKRLNLLRAGPSNGRKATASNFVESLAAGILRSYKPYEVRQFV